MLECYSMDILPYSVDTITRTLEVEPNEPRPSRERRTLLNVDDVADWCMFSIEVRNTYGVPFEVTFEREQPGACDCS